MATEVKVPTLGESVTEATIGEWLKQPGEAVALDEPIASLETDKVAVEVGPSFRLDLARQRLVDLAGGARTQLERGASLGAIAEPVRDIAAIDHQIGPVIRQFPPETLGVAETLLAQRTVEIALSGFGPGGLGMTQEVDAIGRRQRYGHGQIQDRRVFSVAVAIGRRQPPAMSQWPQTWPATRRFEGEAKIGSANNQEKIAR